MSLKTAKKQKLFYDPVKEKVTIIPGFNNKSKSIKF